MSKSNACDHVVLKESWNLPCVLVWKHEKHVWMKTGMEYCMENMYL